MLRKQTSSTCPFGCNERPCCCCCCVLFCKIMLGRVYSARTNLFRTRSSNGTRRASNKTKRKELLCCLLEKKDDSAIITQSRGMSRVFGSQKVESVVRLLPWRGRLMATTQQGRRMRSTTNKCLFAVLFTEYYKVSFVLTFFQLWANRIVWALLLLFKKRRHSTKMFLFK